MSCDFRNLYVLKDKESGKYLNNIWLAQTPEQVTLYMSESAARSQLFRIKSSTFISKGGIGYNSENIVIVCLDINPVREIK